MIRLSGSAGSAESANFVARTISSRWARTNGEMNFSFSPLPYRSAVS